MSTDHPITDHLATILATITTAREAISVDAEALTGRILAGDAEALAEGEAVRQAFNALHDGVNDLARTDAELSEIDSIALTMVCGLLGLFDAVDVANGLEISGDPVVDERFKPVRLAQQRQTRERWLAQLDGQTTRSADDEAFREAIRTDLALIAIGVEAES